MKIRYLIYSAVIFLSLYSCNKTNSLGIEIQPQSDKITAIVDTFYISSKDTIIEAVSAQCNDSASMLLGDYLSAKYGSVKADLIVQVAPPVNYQFPPAGYNPKADSLILFMYYKGFFGSPNEPFEISIYELNKNTPEYNKQYLTSLDINQFLDINDNQLLGRKIATSVLQTIKEDVPKNETYIPTIRYKFSDKQLKRFFEIPQTAYNSIKSFLQEFKGLYITTSYGKSTMLYLFEIDLKLFYHYSYNTKTSKGLDTTITVNNNINYPASKDVRQLNYFRKSADISTKINKIDSVNYITTTFGIYPKITIPVEKIRRRINNNLPDKDIKRELFINSANMSIEITDIDLSKTAMKIPHALYVVPVSEVDNFIRMGGLKLYRDNQSQIAIYNKDKREYSIDMAYIINKLIKKDTSPKEAEYMLIPVDLYSDSGGYIKEIRIAKQLAAVSMRSSKSHSSPLRIELVYSGM